MAYSVLIGEAGGLMNLGVRSWSTLVVAPIVAALAGLATVGLWRPALIVPGLGVRPLLLVLLATGTASVTGTAWACLRACDLSRPVRLSIVLVELVATIAATGVLLDWPTIMTWGVLRGATVVAAATVIALTPQQRRSLRTWAELLLDGWLVAASVFLICWVTLALSGSPLARAPGDLRAALWWLPADLLLAAVTVGLAMRADDARPTAALLYVLAALLAVVADISWALTGARQFGTIEVIVLLASCGAAAVIGPLGPLRPTVPPAPTDRPGATDRSGATGGHPSLLRLPQWAVVPGLIAAVVGARDRVAIATAVSVILGLAAELALASRQNRDLWHSIGRQAERLDQLLAESRDALVHIDAHGIVRFASEAVVDVLGLAPADLVGRNGADLVHPEDYDRLVRQFLGVDAAQRPGCDRVIARVRHADGQWRMVEATVSRRSGPEPGYVFSARDVEERITLEAELRRLASTDALTGLANRHAFLGLVEEQLGKGPAAVLFVDLDGFKAVNDIDGHAAGDRLLREVADTLRRELRGRDVAARLGGDEFAVLLDTDHVTEIRAVADRLVQRLRRMPSDPAHRTSASIGVAVGRYRTAATLLGDADLAMYEAKARGRRRHVMFEPWMRERVAERARMGSALEAACRGEGLLLDAQPIVAMDDGTWVGFEALVRWQDDDTRRMPNEFLPVAEESGLIEPLGRWVIRTALGWVSTWPDTRAGISVNVAGSQLATVGFGDWVHRQLVEAGVLPTRLTLEISERTSLGDVQRATAVLQPLRALGVRIALDDFGTGYSSLGHLAEVPVDELKIDKRFVTGLGRRTQDDALVRAVCRLGGDLGLRVVAEGVETPAQEAILLDHGCRIGQGYRFAQPTPVDRIRPPESDHRPSRVTAWRRSASPTGGRTVAS